MRKSPDALGDGDDRSTLRSPGAPEGSFRAHCAEGVPIGSLQHKGELCAFGELFFGPQKASFRDLRFLTNVTNKGCVKSK